MWSKLLRTGTEERTRIVAHVAHGGAIRLMEAPPAPPWTFEESEREGDGFVATVLKYVLASEPMPLVLLAKIYTVAPGFDPPTPVEGTDWQAALGALFAEAPTVSVRDARQTTMKGELAALEATLDGTAKEPSAPLRVRERRAVAGREQFILSAVGTPSAFDAQQAVVDAFFETAVFEPLADQKK